MELCEYLYVEMMKLFRDTTYDGKDVIVTLVYDKKVIDIADGHYVSLYQTSESDRWFDIGAEHWHKTEHASIDVRTGSKKAYGKMKELIFTVFDGGNVVFRKKDTYDAVLEEGISATSIEAIGSYLRKVTVVDPSIYAENEFVQLKHADGSTEEGWIVDIYGNEVYVWLKEMTLFLTRPAGVNELSDRMRGLFRFVVDVEGQIIHAVQ